MSGNIFDWSTTALNNDSADGDINWKEGQNAKTVNNSARQMMGRLAEFLLDLGGQGTVGGTANAVTLTLESSFTALKSGLICALQPTSDNTAAVTLNVNGIGGKAIRKFDTTGEVALASGDLQAGNFYLLVYDLNANSSAGAWIVLNPTPAVYQASSSKLTDIAALTPTDSNIIVGNGTTWVAESGATARTSLGLGSAATTASSAYATAAQGIKADGASNASNLTSGTVAVARLDSTVWRDANLPSAAQIAGVYAGSAYGAVGTYVFGYTETHVTEGSTYAGSVIYPAGIMTNNAAAISVDTAQAGGSTRGANSFSGTWRAMGRNQVADRDKSVTLFLRIA